MKFKKLEITDFKCFSNRTLEFTDGLNIIHGPNESGKSTIYQALVLSLFGPHPTKEKHFGNLDRKDFTPLGSSSLPKLHLWFLRGEKEINIERDFSEDIVLINKSVNGNLISSDKLKITAARDFIKEELGGVSEDIFQKYASINHAELSRLDAVAYKKEIESMGESIIKVIEAQMGKGLLDAKKRVDDELKKYRQDEWKRIINNEIADLEMNLADTRKADENLIALKKSHDEKSQRKSLCEKRLAELKTVLDKVNLRRKKDEEISKHEEKIHFKDEEYRQLKKMLDEEEDLKKRIKDFPLALKDNPDGIYRELNEYLRQKDVLTSRRQDIASRILKKTDELKKSEDEFKRNFGSFKAEDVQDFKIKENERKSLGEDELKLEIGVAKLRETLENSKRKRMFHNVAAIASIAIAIILVVPGFIFHSRTLWQVLGFIMLLSVVFAIVLFMLGRKMQDPQTENDLVSTSAKLTEIKSKKASLDLMLAQISSILGMDNRIELDKRYEMYRDNLNLIERLKNEIQNEYDNEKSLASDESGNDNLRKSLLEKTGYRTLDDLHANITELNSLLVKHEDLIRKLEQDKARERFSGISSDIGKIGAVLSELKEKLKSDFIGEPLDEDKIAIIEKESEESGIEINSLTRELIEIVTRIKSQEDSNYESSEELEEKLERLKNNLKISLQEKEELEFLREMLGKMVTDFRLEFLPELEKRALELFQAFTGAGDKIFSLSDWPSIKISSSRNNEFEEKHLSHGTRDQLYFALRIAWSDILTPEDLKLPLLWDDPFVYWDAERMKSASKITKALVEMGHQVIVFTHRFELVQHLQDEFLPQNVNLINL